MNDIQIPNNEKIAQYLKQKHTLHMMDRQGSNPFQVKRNLDLQSK